MATNLGFLYEKEQIFWTDSDQGKITGIKRDGTNRQTVIERSETMENVGSDFLTGLAIDWIAGNYRSYITFICFQVPLNEFGFQRMCTGRIPS